MKTIAVLLLVVLGMQNAFCQEYNFETKQFTILKPQKAGDMVTFKVTNINTFRYKVTITGLNVTYATPIPTELQALFRVNDATRTSSEATEGLSKADAATSDMENMANTLKVRGAAIAELADSVQNLADACRAFVDAAEKIREIKYLRAQLISLARQNWSNHSALGAALAPLSIPGIQVMQNQIGKFMDSYQKAETLYDQTIDLAHAANNTSEEKRVKRALERFEEGYEDLDEDDLLKYAEDVDVLQRALRNKDYFVVASAPVQAEGDFLVYEISIEPDETNALLSHEQIFKTRVEIPIHKGWKADFSVGPNFSFGYEAKDVKYFLDPTSNGNGTLVKGKNPSVVTPAVAAMIHAYPKSGKNASYGFLMGVGAGFQADNEMAATYYLGGTVVVGKVQRLMLNGGVSFLRVERIKAAFEAGREYSMDTKIADVTEKVLRPSIFLGISYNITNRIETK